MTVTTKTTCHPLFIDVLQWNWSHHWDKETDDGPDADSCIMHITIHEDNSGALILATTPPLQFTPCSKHYTIKTIWFRKKIIEYKIKVNPIKTHLQLGDILTKMSPQVTFEFLCNLLQGWWQSLLKRECQVTVLRTNRYNHYRTLLYWPSWNLLNFAQEFSISRTYLGFVVLYVQATSPTTNTTNKPIHASSLL